MSGGETFGRPNVGGGWVCGGGRGGWAEDVQASKRLEPGGGWFGSPTQQVFVGAGEDQTRPYKSFCKVKNYLIHKNSKTH